MADMDSPIKRFSAMCAGSPWRPIVTIPATDPTVSRTVGLFLYAGIALSAVVAAVAVVRNILVIRWRANT